MRHAPVRALFSYLCPAPCCIGVRMSSSSGLPCAGSAPLPAIATPAHHAASDYQAMPDMLVDVLLRMEDYITENGIPTLAAADIFSGRGHLTAAFESFGMRPETYDVATGGGAHDILTDQGLGNALFLIARVEPGGLVWFGPPCSSWVWISRRHSRRSRDDVAGDRSSAWVNKANMVAQRVSELARVCAARHVRYVIEQPRSSLLFLYPQVAEALRGTRADRVSLELGRAGSPTPKPIILVGTARWLRTVASQVRRRPMVTSGRTLATVRPGSVDGNRAALAASAAYPRILCCMVARVQATAVGHPIPEVNTNQAIVIDVDSD